MEVFLKWMDFTMSTKAKRQAHHKSTEKYGGVK